MLSAKERPRVRQPEALEDQTLNTFDHTAPARFAASLAPLITKADLAELLRVDRRTIDRMRSRGELPKPALFIGRAPRWTAVAVNDWIEGGGK